MPRRHDSLFDKIANFQALHAAARRAVKGKRKKAGAAGFFANLERELLWRFSIRLRSLLTVIARPALEPLLRLQGRDRAIQ